MDPAGEEPRHAAIKSTLVRGIAVGEHPTVVTPTILRRVNGDFNGGRNRTLVIASTEMLDAHRGGGMAQHKANRDVLAGWQRVAQLDQRTCPSCWPQHGNTFDVDTPGPDDHQQDRCARVAVTRPRADLGFKGMDEPPSVLQEAESTFAGLPREQPKAIMGSKRLALLDSDDASWADLSTERTTAG